LWKIKKMKEDGMKERRAYFAKILLSVATVPLWFVKIFADVGHLPDRTGKIVEVIFRHSMYGNICSLAHPVFAYVSMAIALFSAVMNAVALKAPEGRPVKAVARVAFWSAMGVFLILLLLSLTVSRNY
jgi:hypothetical protein